MKGKSYAGKGTLGDLSDCANLVDSCTPTVYEYVVWWTSLVASPISDYFRISRKYGA